MNVDRVQLEQPCKLVIDLAGEDGPTETWEPLEPVELGQCLRFQLVAAAETAIADKAATEREQLLEQLRAGTATPEQVQAALATVLAGQ